MKTTAAVISKRGNPVVTPVLADEDADEICRFVAGLKPPPVSTPGVAA